MSRARGWQTHWHRHPGVRSGDQLTVGERAADRMRGVMGSWPFVFGFFAVMILWAVANSIFYLGGSHGRHGFDPYPYILLNLFLSMLAGVQAADASASSARTYQVHCCSAAAATAEFTAGSSVHAQTSQAPAQSPAR